MPSLFSGEKPVRKTINDVIEKKINGDVKKRKFRSVPVVVYNGLVLGTRIFEARLKFNAERTSPPRKTY